MVRAPSSVSVVGLARSSVLKSVLLEPATTLLSQLVATPQLPEAAVAWARLVQVPFCAEAVPATISNAAVKAL